LKDRDMDDWKKVTFSQIFRDVVKKYSNKEAIVIGEKRLTYKELDLISDSLGLALLHLGVDKEDNVAIWFPNCVEWIISFIALGKIGAVAVPLNIRFKTNELEYILNQSDSRILIMTDKFHETHYLDIFSNICPEVINSEQARLRCHKVPKLNNVVGLGENFPNVFVKFEELIELGRGMDRKLLLEKQSSLKPDETILIQYTSGTTAFPKGAMLSHDNIIRDAVFFTKRMKLTQEDRIFGPLPLFHVGGSVTSLLASIVVGATYYTMAYFDEEESLKLIEKEKCSMQIGLSTFFIKQMEVKDFHRYDLSSLRTGFCGGGPELQKRVISKMGIDGLCNLYGLSEGSPNVTLTPPDIDLEKRIHKMGPPHPGIELKIADMNDGSILPPDTEGEVCVRGWNVMKGYYNKPEETAKAIDKWGWLHTGDLGTLDEEGFLTFTGRLKNVVRVGGENVSSEEIENFLLSHSKVKYAEIIGVPDYKLDEVIMAFIELKEGEQCNEEEIINFCKGKIASFKIPRYVKFVKEFPMTASGKIKKYELREQAIDELKLPK